MIVELTIENFRGIKHIKFDGLKGINIFVGKNNSSKTSILESIFLNIGAINPQLVPRINAFRELNKMDDSTFRAFFYGFNINNPIKINTIIKKPKQHRNLTITPNQTKGFKEKIINIKDIKSNENTSLYTQEIIGLDSKLSFKESSRGNFKVYKSYIKNTPNGLEILQPQNYDEKIRAIYINPRTIIADGAVRLSKIKLKKKEEHLIKILRNIEPKLRKIEILENNYIYADIGKENLIPFNLLGDGINRLLAILLAIFDNENGVVLIDEIENGFHYMSLETLWRAVFKIAQEHNVQMFVTTHSWENINIFAKVYDELEYNDITLHRIESKNGENLSVKYDNELLLQTLESEWELR